MKRKNNVLFLSLLFFAISPIRLFAQSSEVEMADSMHANGKIYVVVAVVSIVLLALLIFLMIIDKRVRKLENAKTKE